MSTNERLVLLIAEAGRIAGSEYKLAQLLELPQSHVSMWKSGVRTCSPEDRARLAAIAGRDAVQELVRATIEQAKGTRRQEQLRKALGKLSHQTGAALGSVIAITAPLSYSIDYLTRCIEVLTVNQGKRA